MATLTGKAGTVTGVLEVTKWMFEPSAAIVKKATNTTAGYKRGACGTKDSKGTVEVLIDPDAALPWGPGELVSLELILDKDAPADKITVSAFIASSPINVDVDGDEMVACTYAFEGSGAWVGAGVFANL